eukprot:TRINITY_DN784_c7_g1_i1.p2 TRINITY_DN784_c7_g1~~TRINITY_DN784_c7_g1_i1.p2  ORF type:complete len:380 (-),score=114.55 TRINITY_DN784_c7_g1_i1:1341-2366(-)
MIHDVQMDYYGKRLATASSDRTVKVFEVSQDQQTLLVTLEGYDGPVWQIAWGPPKFGTLLATASYDGKVVIWKEESNNTWTKVFDETFDSSVNSVAWAPQSYGLCLAAGVADGNAHVFTYKIDAKQWERKSFVAHKGGVNAVSWGPDVKTGAMLAINTSSSSLQDSKQQSSSSSFSASSASSSSSSSSSSLSSTSSQMLNKLAKRLVTAGCDNRVRIWRYNETDNIWVEQKVFYNSDNAHNDWVRDVAWAPALGLPVNTIASCSEDKTVIIWTEDSNGVWKKSKVIPFKTKVWRVSWSVMGNILAVAQGDNKVSLWKESLNGEWKNLSDVKPESLKEEKKE